jgi:hypothetical protein
MNLFPTPLSLPFRCHIHGLRLLLDLFDFWSILRGDSPLTDAPIAPFKWAIKCHHRHFFRDRTNPLIFASSSLDFRPDAIKELHHICKLSPSSFRDSLRKRDHTFVSSVLHCMQAEPFDIAFIISFFSDHVDWINFRYLFRSRFFEFHEMFGF